MNSPGPLPPVDPDAPEALVTTGGFMFVFFTVGYGEIVADVHTGGHDTWLLPVALGLVFNIIAGRMRQKIRRTP